MQQIALTLLHSPLGAALIGFVGAYLITRTRPAFADLPRELAALMRRVRLRQKGTDGTR